VASGTRLTTDLVNGIINRTEYAADLLRQYKLAAGSGMYVEPHYDGTRVSYLQQVAGGATPKRTIFTYDVEMVLDKVYDFPSDFKFETDADGFVPLDKRNRLIVPQFVRDNPGQYAFRSIGYFWAAMDNPPGETGRYPSWGNQNVYITQSIASLGSFAFGAHPPFPNIFTGKAETAWYGGSGSLIRL
jgi:hypothetical protein